MAGLDFYVFPVTPNRTGGPVPAEVLENFGERLWSLYDSGTKLFDREQLRRVGEQAKEANRSKEPRTISVMGLDGVPVGFNVHVGFRGYIPPRDQYINYARVQVFYQRPENMESINGDHLEHQSYCPIRIKHIAQVEGTPSILRRLPSGTAETFWNTSFRSWEISKSCQLLRDTLKSINLRCKLSKITAFALGSVTADYGEADRERDCTRMATQHAFVGTLREALQEHGAKSQLPCYVQDPDYGDVDERLMGELGLNAVDDPDGLLEIDNHSVVVSMCANIPIGEMVHDLAKPAMIMWEPHKEHRTLQNEANAWGSRVGRWLVENYDEIKLEYLDKATFNGLTLYVRKH